MTQESKPGTETQHTRVSAEAEANACQICLDMLEAFGTRLEIGQKCCEARVLTFAEDRNLSATESERACLRKMVGVLSDLSALGPAIEAALHAAEGVLGRAAEEAPRPASATPLSDALFQEYARDMPKAVARKPYVPPKLRILDTDAKLRKIYRDMGQAFYADVCRLETENAALKEQLQTAALDDSKAAVWEKLAVSENRRLQTEISRLTAENARLEGLLLGRDHAQ